MYREALCLATLAYQAFEITKKPFETAKAVGVMAIAHSQLSEFKEAARLFERARTMFQEQGNDVRAGGVNLHRAIMWLQLGRYSEAKVVAEDAYAAFAKEDVKAKSAFARIISARASVKLKELERAASDAKTAMSLYEKSPTPWVGYQLHQVLGEIHLANDDAPNARTEFRKAVEELERVRANIEPDDLRLNYLKDKVPIYEMLLGTNLQLGDATSLGEAFEAAERSKSRTLVDLLAGSIDSLRHVTWSSVEDIQEALAPDAALIEYFMKDDQVMAFCLSADGFEVVQEICSRTALKRRFGFLQFHLSRLSADPAAAQARASMALVNIQDHLTDLYRMLVRPLESFLRGRKSLVFVPFDFLHYLPFHALFDGSSYLIDRFAINYVPTATMYRLLKTKPIHADGPALLIGVPDRRAPFISEEIESIRAALPNSRSFVGRDATQDRLIREMKEAGLIHIASHASFRPDNPMFSSIQLHDTPLNFFDIYNMKTSACLITLSGCGTGLSSVVAGDELLGLIRGFLHAGAMSVLVSLWDVNDRTTADLMKYFYGYLSEGRPKNESLKLAMLSLREAHPHPYYWAPFFLMGDPS